MYLHTMGSGTLTKVDGTINAAKYVEILNSCLWPGIVGHFTDDNYDIDVIYDISRCSLIQGVK
jgi:hypothetical protein